MAPISFPRKGSRLLTLVPTFYVLKEQRGKRALVRASVWRFNGSSKGFAPARPQVVEQQTSGLAVLGSHEGKPSGQRVLFAAKVQVSVNSGGFVEGGTMHAVLSRRDVLSKCFAAGLLVVIPSLS